MSSDSVAVIRRLLLSLVVVGLVGTATDLLFLQHYEDSAQLIPLFLIAVALLSVIVAALLLTVRCVWFPDVRFSPGRVGP